MPLTETDANRGMGAVTKFQATGQDVLNTSVDTFKQAITNIPWSADKENQHSTTTVSKPTSKPAPDTALDAVSDIDPDDGFAIRYNCNQVRTKINALINNTDIKVGEFQKKLGVSSRSYLTFMRQNGPHAGAGNNTYSAAHQFFAKMEDAGMKIPRTKKGAATGKKSTADDSKNDVSNVHLEGEEEGEVRIFDTCDDIRRKISAHLRTSNTTQAAFSRAISACQARDATPIQSGQVTSFLRKKGPLAGNTSKVFYASYVYFEKLRLKQGKPKTKQREAVEAAWGSEGGVDTKNVSENVSYWCMEGTNLTMNKVGRVETWRGRGGDF